MTAPKSVDLAALQHAAFAGHIGDVFNVVLPGHPPAALNLVEARLLGANRAPVGASREPFSLLFRAPAREFYLPQQILTLEHPQLGRLEIFLVPIGPDGTGMRFEAIFA